MSEEWGPWTEHDGKGCPCVGEYAEVDWLCRVRGLVRGTILAPVEGTLGWIYAKPVPGVEGIVIRYRIRKPRGMAILESILTELPMPTQRVDA